MLSVESCNVELLLSVTVMYVHITYYYQYLIGNKIILKLLTLQIV